ncbi:uncharacterized protein ATC70_013402 [Mucor velutinosus]|uniref:NADP-dependent oxidoreductase domain-containing protein n=1 Tax=Mucor velutinosus TaxID=708070 RepID=A0AAN7D914_9FUNG|nr:hypothetical protein ATC70_013402 [Mucor velutinosus]
MSDSRVFKLNTGANIPAIGLGTWRSKPEEVYDAVKTAIEAGYRHIDAAFVYGNEQQVGQAIKDSNVPREELFITTKLWNTCHRPELVQAAFERSLKNLQLEYLDLYLMHWPVSFQPADVKQPRGEDGVILLDDTHFTTTYAEMEKLLGSRLRAIGVSNFDIPHLEKLATTAKVSPAVNQVELHPYLPQQELVDYCQKHQILLCAYSPLGSSDSPLMKDEAIIAIADKYNATAAQILISWGIERGYAVLPKSVTPSRIISNLKDVRLESQDFERINKLIENQPTRRLGDPYISWDVDVFGLHPGEEKVKYSI